MEIYGRGLFEQNKDSPILSLSSGLMSRRTKKGDKAIYVGPSGPQGYHAFPHLLIFLLSVHLIYTILQV